MAEPASRRNALPRLSTDRLELVPVGPEQLDQMVELNSDPAVMTYIRGGAATPAETMAEWRQRLEHQSDPARGLGYWAGYEAGTFVGWWSASSFAGRREISGVGYRLRSIGWRRGLATEGARAMIGQAFACHDVKQVVASTMAANAASRRVLEKLGMRATSGWAAPEERRDVPRQQEGEVGYVLTRGEWEHAPAPVR
jgi:RimJ/RimL family protein N-acetyltransferase